jgi:hypothetical protein
MTPKQIDIKARKFRLLAGQLLVESRNDKLSQYVRECVKDAHDSMCRAFNALEACDPS